MTRETVVFFRAIALTLLMLTALIASWRVFSEIREAQAPISSTALNE